MSGAAMSATYLWLIASITVFMAANAALKIYAGSGGFWVLVGALALFCLGNFLMVQVMRGQGLGVAISMSVVFQMVSVTLMAVAFFGEKLTAVNWAGVGLGIVAVVLIAWPKVGGA